MKTLPFFLVLLSIWAISSCSSTEFIDPESDLFIGKWGFNYAAQWLRTEGSVEVSKVDEYGSDEIEFFADNTLRYSEVSDTGTVIIDGVWSISYITETAETGDIPVTVLTITLDDQTNDRLKQYAWEVYWDGNDLFQAYTIAENHVYYYELISLD